MLPIFLSLFLKIEAKIPLPNTFYEVNVTLILKPPPLWQKMKGTKKPLDERKEESEKVGLKLNIQKMKIMASGPITSWEIDGETVETVSDFIFGGSKITANGYCSYEIKRHSLEGKL